MAKDSVFEVAHVRTTGWLLTRFKYLLLLVILLPLSFEYLSFFVTPYKLFFELIEIVGLRESHEILSYVYFWTFL